MLSIKNILTIAVSGLAAVTSALPLDTRSISPAIIKARAAAASAAASGLTDLDILQFALTLEWLEATFYQQGFQQFPASDFQALGLSTQNVADLSNVLASEQTHVAVLLSAIAQQSVQPVQPCTYNFGFTDAAGMVATAAVLENVGVSAYLGAAPLVSDSSILTVAAEIVTVESRHQTFIRAVSGSVAIPQAFDTPLGVRSIFTLASQFITSCPDGSNLNIQPFSSLTQSNAASGVTAIGSSLQLSTDATGATACAFTNGGLPGGSVFTAFTNGACEVPQNIAGLTYVHLTNSAPLTGLLTDDITVAGPLVVQIS